MFRIKGVEKVKDTNFIFNSPPPRSENRAGTKATNKYSEYVIIISFPRQQLLGKRASVLLYINQIVCLVWTLFY
jgi:hypothetical protein